VTNNLPATTTPETTHPEPATITKLNAVVHALADLDDHLDNSLNHAALDRLLADLDRLKTAA